MSEAKMVVLYPPPADTEVFDAAYAAEHIPIMHERGVGHFSRVVLTKITGVPGGAAPYYFMAELYFASEQEMKEFTSTPDGAAIGGNAVSISTGGPPGVWFTEELQRIDL